MTAGNLDGVLCIDKPQGFTSFDVVAKLRGILRTRKIGHSGTLDPMATGVLPVFVGNATKAIDLIENHDKAYVAEIQLGITTDTLDITGTVLTQAPSVSITPQDFFQALRSFQGVQMQTPPMFSAVKVGGKKLYELARSGATVERKPRKVHFYSLEMREALPDHRFLIYAACSQGTYIRSLADDLGRQLGCGGVLCGLRRVSASGFTLEDCLSLEQVQKFSDEGKLELLKTDQLFSHLPQITTDVEQRKRFCNGAGLGLNYFSGISINEGDLCRVYDEDKLFLGVGICKEGEIRSRKLFC